VLAAWGITTDGKPAFIGPAPGSGESAGAWHDFLADLNTHDRLTLQDSERGECRSGGPDYADLSAIYAAATSGFSGQVGITFTGRGTSWPRSRRDAGRDQGRLLEALRHPGPEDQTRPRLVELVGHRIIEMADRYSATYPAAVKCLLADREG
jgi:putative transposase